MKIVAVIPAYFEERAIAGAVSDALAFVDDVVVVDDASEDATERLAKEAGAHVLRHVVNRGQGAALQTGTQYALWHLLADIVVHFDADGQMMGEEIPELVEPILAGRADVALGSRFLGRDAERMPITRRVTLWLSIWFTVLHSGIWLTDTHNGFRALSRDAARQLTISLDRMAHASEVLDQIKVKGLQYEEVPVTIRYSEESLEKGQSFWSGFAILKDLAKHKFFDEL